MDEQKTIGPNNHRPITCLPMMWKILPAQIREEIYNSQISRWRLHEEQKGCHKETRGIGDPSYILQDSKTRRKNVAMAWIDKKKAYERIKKKTCRIVYFAVPSNHRVRL